MERVTGIGGVFFRARDPKALLDWYAEHLGVPVAGDGFVIFPESRNTVWSPFAQDTSYMQPGTASFMINYRVENLDALLAALKGEGCNVVDKTETSEQGRFGWVIDPEGNKIELWEPPAGQ